MPQRNTIKEYVPNSYYHVYARGINKQPIFLETADYTYFLGLFDRYLSGKRAVSKDGTLYPDYAESVDLIAYCLMRNHIHLMVYQREDPQTIKRFMSSILTSYSKFFNQKYKRVGSLFESRYKAKRIQEDEPAYFCHISRYIHMNPRRWERYHYSSIRYFVGHKPPVWLRPSVVTEQFAGHKEYLDFLKDYQGSKDELDLLKHDLADN